MRAVCGGSLVACFLVFTGAPRADDAADAKAVIDKALKAMGGEEKVAKFAAATLKCKITHEENGKQTTIVSDVAWQGLDKIRLEGEFTSGGDTGKILLVINGDMGWAKKGDNVSDAPEGLVPAFKNAFYALRMPHLLPGLKDQAFTLTPQGEQKVDNKEAVGLNIGHKDHQEVNVLFDKETGLPVKSQTRITGPDNKEITVEFFYSDYRDVDGVKHPMKITIKAPGGDVVVEISEIQPKDKVDDSAFARP